MRRAARAVMIDAMITIEHLTKRYAPGVGVEDVSFVCETGAVTGFLGPNGAGKSTTLRMVSGLTRPNAGSSNIDGVAYRDLPEPGRRVGVLLDASAQHSGRTGREALTLAAMTMGLSRDRVDQVLQLVGLNETAAKRRIGNYSLGMRQRLGIAHALLGDPGILVLDEPANGLDPEGIIWMRRLLSEFADRGGTVLLSSHLLHEVQAVADRLVIIGKGRIVANGTTVELLAGQGTSTSVMGLDPAALARALEAAQLAFRQAPNPAGGRDAVSFRVDGSAEQVGRAAAAAGVVLTELRSADGAGLEELFLSLTGDATVGTPDGPMKERVA